MRIQNPLKLYDQFSEVAISNDMVMSMLIYI